MPIDTQHQAMGYDRAATMFSPEGHLLQVEYAEKAIKQGSGSLGMVCSDGVFILADKRIRDKLMVSDYASKIYEIDSHLIGSAAGIVSDARVLVEKAQVLSQQHRVTYDSPIEPESVIKEIANLKQQFTQYGGARPFGVSLMVAGINNGKPELYTTEITGNYFSYHANAIGENDNLIKEILRKKYSRNLDLKNGVKLALDIFKEIKGNNFKLEDFEMTYIKSNEEKLRRLEGEEIKKL